MAPDPSGQTVKLSLGGQSCDATANATGVATCVLTYTGPLGPQPLEAKFDGDTYYEPSGDTGRTATVFSFPSRGAFVLGDTTAATATPLTNTTWWGSDWATRNLVSGGAAPSAFKGFAATVSLPTSTPPAACGGPWSTRSGNSASPPASVPSYMGVIVTGKVTKAGDTISGDTKKIVVVKTGAGVLVQPRAPRARDDRGDVPLGESAISPDAG